MIPLLPIFRTNLTPHSLQISLMKSPNRDLMEFVGLFLHSFFDRDRDTKPASAIPLGESLSALFLRYS